MWNEEKDSRIKVINLIHISAIPLYVNIRESEMEVSEIFTTT